MLLRDAARAGGRSSRRGALFLIGDAAAATAFAAGIALSIAHLAGGLAAVWPWLMLLAVGAVLRGLLARGAMLAGVDAAGQVKAAMRRQATTGLFQPIRARSTANTLVEGVEALDGYISRFAPARLAAVITPLALIAVAAFASPVVAGIILFTLAPFIIGMALAGMAAAEESRRQFEALERLSGLFLDRIRALPTVLVFQAEGRTTEQLAIRSRELQRRTVRVLQKAFLSSAVLEFFAALSVALVAVYCGFNLLGLLPFPVPEKLDLARAFFVLALAPEVYAPLRRLAAAYHDRQAAEAAIPAVMELARTHEATVAAAPRPTTAPALGLHEVTLSYPGGEGPVLDRLSLDVPAGGFVAIVGPSGSGKSSLLHLLVGLAPLSGGAITVDGQRLDPGASLAPAVAWAGQTPLIVAGTLAQNIALAWPDASRQQVETAARRAGLGGLIDHRPQGLDTPLDERGGGLSGGERRKLALARAFLKPAPILLLDEPTANLDDDSAAVLLPLILEAARGRTTLIATHDARLIAAAPQVLTLA
ncbi:thiol reductant ABC exporter subunit CydD [Caulobacter sp. NIBR2454]|uniref:thiol reductant ABC exporter subunit CydD n=1 Tax=Caulobacter sp. NIBR2454 TaxID=3015996 RepID=UPI0022B6A24F|nr:thiol reductant ABC exporter subunit CydD [Caulobacter sp. NIBR2454]